MELDFVHSLGLPFLAHRLRRASELIVEGSAAAMARRGFESPARSGSTMLLLLANGPTGIIEIAYRLRLSHPLIIKLTAALAKAGLVRDKADPKDRRRRLVALTAKGEAEARRLQAHSLALAGVFVAMFDEAGADLFAALERFEQAAEARPIADRLEAVLAEEQFPV
jgi:DNA-binding MarR family transcriptional regulator